MYQSWDKLLFMHWPMPVEALRPLIPDLLTIDTFEGTAWMGVTPFTMWGIRPVFSLSLPALSRSHELNVRTYVYVDGIPRVWFLSLDANNPLAVLSARLAFHLPYFTANMSLERRDQTIYFASRRTQVRAPRAEFEAVSTVGERLGQAELGSLDFSLTERYCLYSRQPKDKNYNLITVLYQSSDNVESLKTYIQDAEADGDQELVEFFSGVLENNLEAAQRAKEMLVPRFQREQE